MAQADKMNERKTKQKLLWTKNTSSFANASAAENKIEFFFSLFFFIKGQAAAMAAITKQKYYSKYQKRKEKNRRKAFIKILFLFMVAFITISFPIIL